MTSFLRSQAFNLVAATLLTLAVWLLAAERTSVTESLPGRIQLQVPADADAYLPKGVMKESIELRVNGSRSAVDRARRALAAGITLEAGHGSIPFTAGDHVIDLAGALQAGSMPFEDLVILWVDPPSAKVTIGTLTTVKATVAPPFPPDQLQGDADISPSEVTVRLPSEALAAWPEPRRVNALVELGAFAGDQAQTVTAPLHAPSELAAWTEHVRILPAEASIKARVRRDRGTTTIPRVPLRINASPRAFNEYTLSIDGEPAILNVEVSGTRAAISSLEDWPGTLYAQVDLADRLLAPGELILPISHWNLPPGLEPGRVGEEPAASATVRLMLVPLAPTPQRP